MAKKTQTAAPAAAQSSAKAPAAKPDLSRPVVSTEIRNTPVPKAAAKKEVSFQMIAERAYEISQSGTGSSPDENWFRAERELRGA